MEGIARMLSNNVEKIKEKLSKSDCFCYFLGKYFSLCQVSSSSWLKSGEFAHAFENFGQKTSISSQMQWDCRYQRVFVFSQLDSPGWSVSGPLLHFQLFPLCPPELLPASRFFSLDFYQDSAPFHFKFSKSRGANMSFNRRPPRGSGSRWILPEILFSWWSPPCFCWLIKKEFYVCFQQKNHFCFVPIFLTIVWWKL